MQVIIFFLRIFLSIYGFLKGSDFKYSKEIEGNFKYMDISEKLWWAYKALIRQVEYAEKGKGIEEYFRKQDFSFIQNEHGSPKSKLTISFGGDLSCSEVITPQSTVKLWDDIEDFYFSADIVCANLEAPIYSKKPPSGVPRVCLTAPAMNMSEEMFDVYSRKGISFFSTANNHSLDMGDQGLRETLDFLDKKGFGHVGTSRTPFEQDDIPVIEKNGIRCAFLSYTFGLNGFEYEQGKEYTVNLIRLNKPQEDISLIRRHIEIAKQKKADIIIAMLHWSLEFETYPIRNIMDMGHRIIESGVDVIIGTHPHVSQPIEKYEYYDKAEGMKKEGFIAYSLGELASYNAFSLNSRLAFILKLEIVKGEGANALKANISKISLLPIYTRIRMFKNQRYEYSLLDFIKTLKMIEEKSDSISLDRKEVKEFKRLKSLLYNKLLPEKHEHLL